MVSAATIAISMALITVTFCCWCADLARTFPLSMDLGHKESSSCKPPVHKPPSISWYSHRGPKTKGLLNRGLHDTDPDWPFLLNPLILKS